MKNNILILMAILFYHPLLANKPVELFGTTSVPADTMHVTNGNNVASTRQYMFNGPIKGAATLYGYVEKVTGTTDPTITVEVKLWFSNTDDGEWHTLGTLSPTGATQLKYEFNLSAQDWWKFCQGYEVRFTMSTGEAREYAIQAKGLDD